MTGAGGQIPYPPGDKRRGGRKPKDGVTPKRRRLAQQCRRTGDIFLRVAAELDTGSVIELLQQDMPDPSEPVFDWSDDETEYYLMCMSRRWTPEKMHASPAWPRFNLNTFMRRHLHDSKFRDRVNTARSGSAMLEQDYQLAVAQAPNPDGSMPFEQQRKTLTGVLGERITKNNPQAYGQRVAMKIEGEITVREPGRRAGSDAWLSEMKAPSLLLEGVVAEDVVAEETG